MENNEITTGKIILAMIYLLMCPVLIISLAGDWYWVEGWIFTIWFLTMCASTLIYLYRKDPALFAERFRKPGTGNQKEWDKYLVVALQILFLAWLVIMPLDAKRYEWTANFPVWLKVLGGIGLLVSFFFIYRSCIDNTFASTLVRIQTERKQQVVSTGVYAFVRHPMYLGGILMSIGAPALLGYKYGILIGVIVSLLIIARIIGEEKMLVKELSGYTDYRNKVKYRLIPLVW
jgi:protein-S-isoprenylcysteine O-methyltransferase Ste14